MNDKDASDMPRLAVGAGKAPTDAQIEAVARKLFGEPVGDWFSSVGRPFARAVLALSPPAIQEVVKGEADALLRQALEALESCDAAAMEDGANQWFDEKLVDAAHEAIRAVLATPPPAPSSPAPVAESAGYMASPMCPRCGAHPKGITHACIPSNAAAPSTVQGMSDAFAGMDIGQTWTKEHSLNYPQSAANIINAARAIIAANPTALPDGGSKA